MMQTAIGMLQRDGWNGSGTSRLEKATEDTTTIVCICLHFLHLAEITEFIK
jgi:hypothetical protein